METFVWIVVCLLGWVWMMWMIYIHFHPKSKFSYHYLLHTKFASDLDQTKAALYQSHNVIDESKPSDIDTVRDQASKQKSNLN